MAPRQWAVLGGTGRRPTLAGQRGARLGCPCATSPRTCAEGATPHDERASGRDVGNVARFAGRMRGIVGPRRSLAGWAGRLAPWLPHVFRGRSRSRRRGKEGLDACRRYGNPAPEVLIPRRSAVRAEDEHGNVDADDQTLLACVSTQYLTIILAIPQIPRSKPRCLLDHSLYPKYYRD